MYRTVFSAAMAAIPFAAALALAFAGVRMWRGVRTEPDGTTDRVPRAPLVAVLCLALAVVCLGLGGLWMWALFA